MSPLHPVILILFTLLTLVLSWPLPLRIFDWVPGVAQWAFDESTFVWNIWYFKHSLIDGLRSPLHTDLLYYPLGIDLILYTYNFFNAIIAQPLHMAIGLVFASNVTVLLSTILSGYGAFLLVRYLLSGRQTTDRSAQTADSEIHNSPFTIHHSQFSPHLVTLSSLLAGILYAFASNRAIYATLGHYDMVTTQWIPFYALTLLQSLDARRGPAQRRNSARLAGIFFAFNGLAEMITAVFLAIFTIIVVLGQIFSTQRRKGAEAHREKEREPRITHHALRLTLSSLLLIGLTAFLLWSPVLVPILVQFLTNDFSLKGWGEAIPLSTDLLGWFTPTVLHPLFGGDLVAELRRVQLRALEGGVTGFRDVNTVFVGWVSLGLALLGAWRYGKRVAIWLWTALIFGLFTLGPFLQINGQYRFDLDGVETSFPLPFALLHSIPIIKANRAPNRNSVILMLAVAVLVGYAVYWILGKVKNKELRMGRFSFRQWAPLMLHSLFIFLLLFEHLALPLPLSDARVPAVYEIIAADPRPVSVMHAPLGWRNSFGVFGAERTQLQYFQTVHDKPMIGGNISRAPDFKMDYFKRIPLFEAIAQIENGNEVPAELAEAAAAQANELVYLYNVGYVLLMPPIEQRFPYADTWQATWDFYKAVLPLESAPFWTGDGIEAYRVIQPNGADSFTLDLGTAGTFPYRGDGWDDAETDTPYGLAAIWATAEQSCLFLPLRTLETDAVYALHAQIRPFDYPGSSPQTAQVIVNGTALETIDLANDWQTGNWRVPASSLRNSVNQVCFEWGYTAIPRTVIGGNRQIGSTGVSLPVDVELKAFADGAWISVFDEKSGAAVDGSAGRRGVNVTVLDPQSGEIVAMQGFDTAANAFESENLRAFLAQIPQGSPVLIASRGEAGAFLDTTFEDIGALFALDELRQNQFALIGVKGAAAGTALQMLDPNEAFLRLGLNPDRRSLAAAVGQVEVIKSKK